MKKITRAMLRGKPLIHRNNPWHNDSFDCSRAKITECEYGKEDPRQFCLGLVEWKDGDDCGPACKECQMCRAWIFGEHGDIPWSKDIEFNPEARKEVCNG